MKERASGEAAGHGPGAADEEIEILEVVGVDEDAPPPGDGDDVAAAEIELTVDDDPLAERATGSAAPDEADGDRGERLLRLQAEFDNYRKRIERERAEYREQANSALVANLLPILDNFERAFGAPQTEQYDDFRDGVALIYRQLMDELGREGLRAVEAVGQPFDPTMHEAVATEAGSSQPPSTVLEEFLRGYFFKDRLLRPAQVKVSVERPEAHGGAGAKESRDG